MEQQLKNYRSDFFILLLLTFAIAVIGDNATEALVLSNYSSDIISKMFSVNAVILFLFSLFSMAIVDKFNRAKLYQAFLVLYAIIVLIATNLYYVGNKWVLIPLYSISYSGKILSFFFVWTMANDVTDARRGLRDFPIIASGGTLGALITTFTIPTIVSSISPDKLLLVWIIPMVIVFGYVEKIKNRYGFYFKRKYKGKRTIKIKPHELIENLVILKSEPLLLRMALAYFLLFFLIFNQQYLFFTCLKDKFVSALEISKFIGYFTGISLLITFALQLFISGKVMRLLGVIRTLYILPILLSISFLLLFLGIENNSAYIFHIVVGGVALRIALFDSFFSPGYQNFFSSLPPNMRGNAKLVVDGVIKPIAMISSTIWIAQKIDNLVDALVLLIFSLIALFLLHTLKKRYISSLIRNLSEGTTNSALSILDEAQIFNSKEGLLKLKEIIDSSYYEVQRFAVDILIAIDTVESVNVLLTNFHIREPKIQSYIITRLSKSNVSTVIPFIYDLLHISPYPRVIADGLWALGKMDAIDPGQVIGFLKSETPRIRGNCIVILSNTGYMDTDEIEIHIRAMLYHPSENIRATGLWVLSQINVTDAIKDDLRSFWRENSLQVVKNLYIWRQFIHSVISCEDLYLLKMLLLQYEEIDELKQDILKEGIFEYANKYGIESILMVENEVKGITRSILIEAISKSAPQLTPQQEVLVTKFAQEEYYSAINSRNLIIKLRNRKEPELKLLRDILIENELLVHLRNIFSSTLILDKSGRLVAMESSFVDENGNINPHVIEIFDTLRSNKVNRLLVSYNELETNTLAKKDLGDSIREFSYLTNSVLIKSLIRYIEQKEII